MARQDPGSFGQICEINNKRYPDWLSVYRDFQKGVVKLSSPVKLYSSTGDNDDKYEFAYEVRDRLRYRMSAETAYKIADTCLDDREVNEFLRTFTAINLGETYKFIIFAQSIKQSEWFLDHIKRAITTMEGYASWCRSASPDGTSVYLGKKLGVLPPEYDMFSPNEKRIFRTLAVPALNTRVAHMGRLSTAVQILGPKNELLELAMKTFVKVCHQRVLWDGIFEHCCLPMPRWSINMFAKVLIDYLLEMPAPKQRSAIKTVDINFKRSSGEELRLNFMHGCNILTHPYCGDKKVIKQTLFEIKLKEQK